MCFGLTNGKNPSSSIYDVRLQPEILTSEQALEQAKAFARAERDKAL